MAFFGARRGRKAVLERGEDEFMDRWVAERQKVLTAIQRALSLCGTDAEGKRRRAAIKYIWEPAIVCPNFMRSLYLIHYLALHLLLTCLLFYHFSAFFCLFPKGFQCLFVDVTAFLSLMVGFTIVVISF